MIAQALAQLSPDIVLSVTQPPHSAGIVIAASAICIVMPDIVTAGIVTAGIAPSIKATERTKARIGRRRTDRIGGL